MQIKRQSQHSKKQKILFMRMGKRRSSMKNKVKALLSLTILLYIASCNNPDSKADLRYGTSVFREKCSACHGRFDGYQNAPGLITLQSCDSITLIGRLRNIKNDSIHKGRIEPYNDKEMNSIYLYIRHYFEHRY